MITSMNRRVRWTAAVVLALLSMGALASHESSPADAAATLDATVYVANSGSNTVTPIAVATNTAGAPIPTGSVPQSIAITPDGQTAYVVNSDRTT